MSVYYKPYLSPYAHHMCVMHDHQRGLVVKAMAKKKCLGAGANLHIVSVYITKICDSTEYKMHIASAVMLAV